MESVPPYVAAFQEQFELMVNSIDAGSVAPAAFTRGLITDRQREECFRETSSFKKAELLLGYVGKTIRGPDDTNFHKFTTILRSTGHVTQVEQLGESY